MPEPFQYQSSAVVNESVPPPEIVLPPQSPDPPVIPEKSTFDPPLAKVISLKSTLEHPDMVAPVRVRVRAVPRVSEETRTRLIAELPSMLRVLVTVMFEARISVSVFTAVPVLLRVWKEKAPLIVGVVPFNVTALLLWVKVPACKYNAVVDVPPIFNSSKMLKVSPELLKVTLGKVIPAQVMSLVPAPVKVILDVAAVIVYVMPLAMIKLSPPPF